MIININNISDSDLVKMCDEIYEWRNTGTLQKGLFKSYLDVHDIDCRTLEDMLIMEANNRFRNMVKLLFTTNPSLYISK